MHLDAVAVAVASSQPISYDTGSMLAHFSGCSHHRPANSQSISCDRTTVTTPTQVVGVSDWALINDLFGDSHGNFENPRKIGASAGFFSSVGSGKTTPCQHFSSVWDGRRQPGLPAVAPPRRAFFAPPVRMLENYPTKVDKQRLTEWILRWARCNPSRALSPVAACVRRVVNNARPLSALSLSQSLSFDQ